MLHNMTSKLSPKILPVFSWFMLFFIQSLEALSKIELVQHKDIGSQVVNPHPFIYAYNNKNICSSDTDLLIWIHTSPNHQKHRIIIRETWANPNNYLRHKAALVFFLGTTSDEKTQAMISYENDFYQDLVQESYMDSYRNLTYKAIQGCKWVTNYCKSAKMILKADDDMVIDIYQLFNHLHHLQADGLVLNNTILCEVWKGRYPDRGSSKWHVNKTEFAENVYPTYCPGLALMMTADLVPKLYNASLYEPYFWIDDVYFTGILAKRVNASFESLASTIHFGSSQLIREQTQVQDPHKFLFYHVNGQNMKISLWEQLRARERLRQVSGIGRSYV